MTLTQDPHRTNGRADGTERTEERKELRVCLEFSSGQGRTEGTNRRAHEGRSGEEGRTLTQREVRRHSKFLGSVQCPSPETEGRPYSEVSGLALTESMDGAHTEIRSSRPGPGRRVLVRPGSRRLSGSLQTATGTKIPPSTRST